MNVFDTIRNALAGRGTKPRTIEEVGDTFYVGESPNAFRDRTDWNFQEIIENSLMAWRENPLARRIVNLQTQYVIGDGIGIDCEDEHAAAFLKNFWNEPLNHMDIRITEWCDELTRTGNLFVLISSDLNGMSYVRAIPATAVKNIETAKNDYEQMLWIEYQDDDELNIKRIDAEDKNFPTMEPRIMQFTVNRPVGAKWGEPDLAPVLIWLQRYSGWLEDRARLNHYRNCFLFKVTTAETSEQKRIERQRQLNAKPLSPGSILVTTPAEEWDVLSAKLESNEAEADGLALKKQIAAGVGIPLHFLAEPESQNKASAEAAGGATYRTFEQRQQVFLWIVEQILRSALRRRRLVDHELNSEIEVRLIGSDIYQLDNTNLSTAAATMSNVCTQMRKLGYITREEYIRLVYKFAGEEPDPDVLLRAASDQTWDEYEFLTFMSAINNNNNGDNSDATKYNTTTIDGSVAHYDQGAEVN